MSPQTAERRAPVGKPRLDLGALPWGWIAAAAALVLCLVGVQVLVAGPSFVTLTVQNPTPYALQIQASNGSGDGWVDVAVAGRHATTIAPEVIDEGSTWTFRFSSQGQSGGTLTMSRAQLDETGWRLSIPSTVQTRLEAEGAPPTP